MSEITSVVTTREGRAADSRRPLLLTPRANLAGYVASRLGRALLFVLAATSVLAVLAILYFIFREAAGFFVGPAADASAGAAGFWATLGAAMRRLAELLAGNQWYPEAEAAEFGSFNIIFDSLYVSGGAMVIAVPVGLLAAVCLSDILPFSVRQATKPVVEILASIPSVAFGFFAVLVLAPWLQNHLGIPTGTNALNAAVILAVMAIPTIVSISEDALTAAGRELREASYACGATRAETALLVVVPAAHSGIIAAMILGLMRAVGETMVVWMASGNAAQIPHPWWDMTQSVRTLTATIAGEMGETVQGSPHYRALFAMGLVLLVFTFGLNLATEHFLRAARRQGGGR